jgi:hypothetical protein
VRSRVVSSRSGKAGEWLAFNGATDTNVTGLTVQKGDTIDFVTDANGTHTSDSFTWPVSMTVKSDGQPDQAIESVAAFSGPRESSAVIAGQIIRAWELALCRTPTNDELRLAVEFAAAQMATFNRNSVALPAGRTPARQAIVSLCQSFFSSNEFLYVE